MSLVGRFLILANKFGTHNAVKGYSQTLTRCSLYVSNIANMSLDEHVSCQIHVILTSFFCTIALNNLTMPLLHSLKQISSFRKVWRIAEL